MNTWIRIAVLSAMLALSGAQQGLAYRKIKCYVPVAPEIKLIGVKKVAVLDFEEKGGHHNYWGDDASVGRDIANKVIEMLLQENRGMMGLQHGALVPIPGAVTYYPNATTRMFEVVERSQIDQVLREQNMGQRGRIDDAQAAALGKIFGVQANIIGEYSSEVTEGGEAGCSKRGVKLDITMKVQNIETGSIMGVKTATRMISDMVCTGDSRRLATKSELTTEAIYFAVWDLVIAIAPTFVKADIELERVDNKEIKKACEDAAKIAETDPRSAYPLYKSAHDVDPYNPEILYNLAAVHGALGDAESARDYYKRAVELKSDKKYQESARGIEFLVATNEYLAAMGHPVNVIDFAVAGVGSGGGSVKVRTKGSSADRVEVFESADRSSAVLAKVPGGIELSSLGNQGEWLKVRLPDGKEGYILSSEVK